MTFLARSFAVVLLIVTFIRFAAAQDSVTPSAGSGIARADELLRSGKPHDALNLLKQLAETSPDSPGLEAALGKAYFENRQFAPAVSHLKSALRQNNSDLESSQLLALSYFASGNYSDALPILEALGPRLPKNSADAPYLLATCYLMTKQPDKARKALADMFSVSPNSAMAHLMLAKFLVRQRLEDDAVPEIQSALQQDPRLPMAHFLLGEIDLHKGNASVAAEELQKELAINPTIWLVYWRLGDALVRLEKYDEAEKILKEAIWLNEASSGAYILLGEISLKRNDPALAVGFLEHALKLDPQNDYVHYFLGKAYQALGRSAESNQHFEIARSLRNEKRSDEQQAVLRAVP